MIRIIEKGPGAKSPRPIRFLGLVAAILTIAAFVGMFPAAASASGSVRKVGDFPRPNGGLTTAANGNIILDRGARRGYQAVMVDQTTISEFNLDTLAQTGRSVVVDPLQAAQPAGGPLEWLWELDQIHHRLFVVTVVSQGRFDAYKLVTIDLVAMTASAPVDIWPLQDRIPLAISYYAPQDKIYLLARTLVEAPQHRSLFFLEARDTSMGHIWDRDHQLNECFSMTDERYPPTLSRSLINKSLIYLNCYNSGAVQAQVVRVHLDEAGNVAGDDDIFPAIPGPLSTKFDPGSDRMFFLTTNSGAGRGAWVFDGIKRSFLGVIATGDARLGAADYSMGLDPEHGRLYMQTPAGLIVADARRTPLPAGLLLRDFASPGFGTIQVDSAKHRLFVPDLGSAQLGSPPDKFLVLEDAVSQSVDPPPGDPDSLTTDQAEAPGVTEVNVSGGASAYGLRSLLTGGAQKAAWNILLPYLAPSDFLTGWNALNGLPLDQGNRDLFISRVSGVSLTDGSADAAATGAEADQGTKGDIKNGGSSWPVIASECHDGADKPVTVTGANGSSGASCDLVSRSAWGAAGTDKVTGSNAVELRSSTAISFVRKDPARGLVSTSEDPARGLVSTSEAVVRGITIMKSIRIGELRTSAESWAKGRPGTADATFTRTLSDVSIDTNNDGAFNGPADFNCHVCDPSSVGPAMQKALAGRASVGFPAPDNEFFHGSKGGYQALVSRPRFDSYAARSLNDDDSNEVAGIEIVFFSDAKAGRSREVIELAGVQAESHYGIYPVPKNSSSGQLIDVALPPDLPIAGAPSTIVGSVDTMVGGHAPVTTSFLKKIITKIAAGWKLFTAHPKDGVLLASVWALMLLPAYLLQRRRLLGAAG